MHQFKQTELKSRTVRQIANDLSYKLEDTCFDLEKGIDFELNFRKLVKLLRKKKSKGLNLLGGGRGSRRGSQNQRMG